MRKSGYLLERFVCQTLQVRGLGSFWRRKTAAAILWKDCRGFFDALVL